VKVFARELEIRLRQATGDGERLGALLELGALHADERRERDGLRAAREALEIARAAGDAPAAARALALAARCHYQRGDHFSAVASGVDAVDAFGAEDPPGCAGALRYVALALFAVEDLPHAEEAAQRAVRHAAGSGLAEAEARAVHGQVLAQRGRAHAARQQLRQAGALYRRAGERVGLKRITVLVAHTYRAQANAAQAAGQAAQARLQWRHAARVYRTALGFAQRAQDDAAILAAIAECDCGLGSIDAAYEHALTAARLAESEQALATLALAKLWESRALRAMSRVQAAERACGQALAAAAQAGDDRLTIECLHAHAKLQDQLGRFQAGADLEERARRLEQQRKALLERLRGQLPPLWSRDGGSSSIVKVNFRA
jgi:tetratricopeptide (TPR) repeat protein